MTPRRTLTAAVTVVITSVVASLAFGHTGGSTGYASISVAGQNVRYSLTLWPAALPPAIADDLRRVREGDEPSRERLLGMIRDKIAIAVRSRRCAAGQGSLAPAPPGADSVTLVVDFACDGDVRDLTVRDDLFDVFGADYHTLARIDAPDRTTQFAFTPETRETRVTLAGGTGSRHGLGSFVLLGIGHILTGWDHLLFLLGLLLCGGGWLALAKIVTAFTLAHSITLALAVLDIVVLPDRLVEAVIALSIAFVAAENLFSKPVVARRWLVSFCFGLVHGFGFSSALRELGLASSGLLVSLFGFNAGVEIGQGLVVAVALPALMLLRRTRWERRMVWGSSVAILLVGAVLFVERAFF
jgi:HupE / UreJ protein